MQLKIIVILILTSIMTITVTAPPVLHPKYGESSIAKIKLHDEENDDDEKEKEDDKHFPEEEDGKGKNSDKEKHVPCEDEITGKVSTENLPQYDIYHLLENAGGAPGDLHRNFTVDSVGSPLYEKVYFYGDTDWKTWIRREKIYRHKVELPDEKLKVRGTFFWKPDDFCGWFRRAFYRVDKDVFSVEISYGTKCTLQVDEHGYANIDSKFHCIPETIIHVPAILNQKAENITIGPEPLSYILQLHMTTRDTSVVPVDSFQIPKDPS